MAARRICHAVRGFVRRELDLDVNGRLLLLAVSGGADSMALLAALYALRPSMGHELRVAHVDHGLRPESGVEARTVAGLCRAWRIPCGVRATAVAAHARRLGLGLEETARRLRYAILRGERKRCDATWICTGHHSGDLQEDMLLRLLRGTGWPALGGMAALDPRRHILRPLLHVEPDALRVLLRHCGLTWVEDASNADMRFTRNRLRHALLPPLRRESPSLPGHVRHLWRMARDDEAHWDNLLEGLLAEHGVAPTSAVMQLPAALLGRADRATRMRLYMKAVRHIGGGQARADTLFKLDAAWEVGRGGGTFQLPGRVSARLRQRAITFTRQE